MAKAKITKKQKAIQEKTFLLMSRINKLRRLPKADSENAIERRDAAMLESLRHMEVPDERLMIFLRVIAVLCSVNPDSVPCLQGLFPEFFAIQIGLINGLALGME